VECRNVRAGGIELARHRGRHDKRSRSRLSPGRCQARARLVCFVAQEVRFRANLTA
jgi:hypothetical protein